MKIKRALFFFLISALILLCLTACIKEKEPETMAKSYYDFFDTVSVIISYEGDSSEEFAENCEQVSKLLLKYHKLFDIYYEYDGINNLKTVNKNAGVAPVKIDSELIDFLLYCKEVYKLTSGKTNIAMGSVLKLWHDEREMAEAWPNKAKLPDFNALENAARHTDIDNLIIDKDAGTVYISDPQMQLDVGAIAKGYATERAAELLISRGVTSYVLNIGGNIRAIGEKANGGAWVTGITNPDKSSSEAFACRVEIRDTSLVTSGDYERYYTVDGVRYHHIIDPDTLMPSRYFSSVSVFVKDSGLSDALSTALFVMSYEDGLELVKSLGAEAVWIKSDGTVLKSDGIALLDN
jgi:thiamine biosynthesis lipoprotein